MRYRTRMRTTYEYEYVPVLYDSNMAQRSRYEYSYEYGSGKKSAYARNESPYNMICPCINESDVYGTCAVEQQGGSSSLPHMV